MIELLSKRMGFDLAELDSFYLEVQVAEPVIKIILVLLLYSPKLVESTVHAAEE